MSNVICWGLRTGRFREVDQLFSERSVSVDAANRRLCSRGPANRRFGVVVGLLLITFAFALAGCGSEKTSACTPGASSACTCSNGNSGAQTCNSDGTFAACECTGSTQQTDGGVGPDADACSEQTRRECHQGDVYRADACTGVRGSLVESCEQGCSNGVCTGCSGGFERDCRGGDVVQIDKCTDSVVSTVESCEYGCADADCRPCQPDCSARQCGTDPVCGESCGECSGINSCNNTGQCTEADTWLTVEIDSQQFHGTGTGYLSSSYDVSHDTATVYAVGSSSQSYASVSVDDVSQHDSFANNCASSNQAAFLWLSLNSGEIPAAWRGTSFDRGDCDNSGPDEDVVTSYQLDLTTVDSDRITGTFSITVEGAGPRQGSTLHANGRFDEALEPR